MLKNTPKKIALSFDVEDWFTVRNMREFVDQDNWEKQEQRIHVGLDFILNELEKKNIKATFFILGWVADKFPDLVYKISSKGHEIGSHGYAHTPIDLLTKDGFEDDLKKSITAISRITHKKVKGFRAPSFSITDETIWAIDILKSHGIEYDSSIFSITHPDYGIKNFPRELTSVNGLLEVPLFKSKFFGVNLPVCGGGYFRMLPYPLIKSSLSQTLSDEPVVMYFHPWEFDPEQPKIPLGRLKKFRHYVGLKSNREKFKKLLDDFEFTTMENLIESQSKTIKEYRVY